MRLSIEKTSIYFLVFMTIGLSAHAGDGVRVAAIIPESVGAQWFYPVDELAAEEAAIVGASGFIVGKAVMSLGKEAFASKARQSALDNLSKLGSVVNIENLKSNISVALGDSIKKSDLVSHYDPDFSAPTLRSIADYLGSIEEENLIVLRVDVALTPNLESVEIKTIITKFEKSRLKKSVGKSKYEFKKQRTSKVYRHIYQSDFSTPEYSFEKSVPLVDDLSKFYKQANADIRKTKASAIKTKKLKRRNREVKRLRQEVTDATLADSSRVLRDWRAEDGAAIKEKVEEGLAVLSKDLPTIIDFVLTGGELDTSSTDIYTVNFNHPIDYFTNMDFESVEVLNTTLDRMTVKIKDSVFYSFPANEVPRLYSSPYRRSLYGGEFEFVDFYVD